MKKMQFAAMLTVIFAVASAAYPEEVTYSRDIWPVFEAKCIVCHGPDSPELPEFEKDKDGYKGKGKGPRMDSYSYMISFIGWPDTGAIMRRLNDGRNTKDGKPGNMYQYLGATEEERQQNFSLFAKWIGNWTLKKVPDLTKEELNSIKVRY